MGEEDDGLSLSLSLKCFGNPDPTPLLNPPDLRPHNKSSLFDSLQPPSGWSIATRSHFPAIDVNQPSALAPEVEVSSPNSTLSSVSGKRSERGEDDAGAGIRAGDEDESAGGEAGRKKLRLTREEATVLEKAFEENSTLNPKQKVALASQLNLRPRQVEVWFQNRRARTKLKQTEVDCEYLRRRCDHLTEENRRLQEELNELRALKHTSQSYTHANPPTTLSMCPSCERVAVLPTSSAATSSTVDVLHHLKSPIRKTKEHQT